MTARSSLVSPLEKLKGMVLLDDVGEEYKMEFINERPQPTLIHTCFMAFPIDIEVYDAEGKVIQVIENMKPWRVKFINAPVARMIEKRHEDTHITI